MANLNSVESQNLSNDENDCVKIVALNEGQEETTENFMALNTQCVLEVTDAKKKRQPTKGKTLITTQKKAVMNNNLMKWLNNFWQSESTLRVMKPFLKRINDAALKSKNMKLFNVGQTLQKIMKEFFLYMKTQKMDLTDCSYNIFEEWYLNEGLSMTYGKLQSMVWENDLENLLFDHYSTVLMELEDRQESMDEVEAENTTSREYSSLQNMKNISTSSMTARTRDPHADASTSKESEIMSQMPATPKKSVDGRHRKSTMSQRENSHSSKRKIVEWNSDVEEYEIGSLFQQRNKRKTVEEESEPEVELKAPAPKKMRKRQVSTEDEEEDLNETPNEDDFSSMVANHARAHSLTTSTGKISQSILIKEEDGYLNISSPGERGSMVIKLELYPFKECVKLGKNQFWTKRIFSCMGLSSGEDSRVQKLVMKLKYELTKQILRLRDVKVEKKALTGWKSF